MPQPLAFLNDEEMHWLNDLGLPNQRRWLNHRNSVTNTAERFPPPPRIVAQGVPTKKLPPAKTQRRKGRRKERLRHFAYFFAPLREKNLTEREFAGAAAFEAAAHLQQLVEHFSALGAARGKLRVRLFVHVLEAVEFVGDVKRGKDCDF